MSTNTARLIYRNQEYTVPAGMTIRDAIRKIGLAPEAILAVHDGQLITDDILLQADMTIKLIAVISGGRL